MRREGMSDEERRALRDEYERERARRKREAQSLRFGAPYVLAAVAGAAAWWGVRYWLAATIGIAAFAGEDAATETINRAGLGVGVAVWLAVTALVLVVRNGIEVVSGGDGSP